MDFSGMQISYSEQALSVMEERGILQEDVEEVISWAEGKGGKLINTENGHFLGKKRIGSFTAYAEYVVQDGRILVLSAYAHHSELREDEEEK